MQKAILYALALVSLGGSIYFSLEHNRKFKELEALRLDTNQKNAMVTANAEVKEAEFRKLTEDLAVAEDKRDASKSALDLANTEGSNLERDVSNLNDTISGQKAEMDQINSDLAALDREFQELGADVTFDNVSDKVDEMTAQRDSLEERLNELNTLIEGAEKSLATKREDIGRLTRRETQRSARISRNAEESVITAVNQDWGFLVIGAGSNSGFAPQTNMLVMREGRLIGQVRPTAIEPTQTIAEIDFESLPVGARIQPGDRVMIAKPASN